MTAWVAGLAFVSANLGSLELLGWAGNAYQYGILASHWYWIGAIPAMVFLGLVMMPFYYISKTHSVPGYLQLRYGPEASALSAPIRAIPRPCCSAGFNKIYGAAAAKAEPAKPSGSYHGKVGFILD